MNIQKVYQKILSNLKTAKIPNSENETREIFCYILKKDWAFLLVHPEKELAEKQAREIDKLIKRRLKNEPLAYILGYKNFYGLDFVVDKNVLIPRPETELIVEKVLSLLSNKLLNKTTYIDIGTGSGCIPISIIKKLSEKHNETSPCLKVGPKEFLRRTESTINCFATDISNKALEIAKKNTEKHKVFNQIKFIQGTLLSPFLTSGDSISKMKIKPLHYKLPTTSRHLILTANLPYLSEKIYNSTHKSVKDFEPKKALIAGKDGLNYYRKLLSQVKILKTRSPKIKITAFFEISPEQKNLIEKEIIKKFPKAKIKSYKDLAGKWRMIKIIFI